jgi:hypothetical protein
MSLNDPNSYLTWDIPTLKRELDKKDIEYRTRSFSPREYYISVWEVKVLNLHESTNSGNPSSGENHPQNSVNSNSKLLHKDETEIVLSKDSSDTNELKRKIEETEIIDPKIQKTSNKTVEEPEDIVVCPCNADYEDGLMVQCEKCLFWQHADCATGLEDPTEQDVEKLENYICEFCTLESVKKKKKPKKTKEEEDYDPDESESEQSQSSSESE